MVSDEGDLDVALLRTLGTSTVSDALDRLGIEGQCFGIRPLDRTFRLAGPAFTVRYGAAGSGTGSVGDFLDSVGPGQVAVLDNRGRTDATVWGDLMTLAAHRQRLAGTVIDGVCRDVDRAMEVGYPLFSRGSWMRTGKDRVNLEEIGGPVVIGGVRVEPGDLILGDGDGVLAVPKRGFAQVAAVAREIEAAEVAIRAAINSGETLGRARASVGYHQLQTRRSGGGT